MKNLNRKISVLTLGLVGTCIMGVGFSESNEAQSMMGIRRFFSSLFGSGQKAKTTTTVRIEGNKKIINRSEANGNHTRIQIPIRTNQHGGNQSTSSKIAQGLGVNTSSNLRPHTSRVKPSPTVELTSVYNYSALSYLGDGKLGRVEFLTERQSPTLTAGYVGIPMNTSGLNGSR